MFCYLCFLLTRVLSGASCLWFGFLRGGKESERGRKDEGTRESGRREMISLQDTNFTLNIPFSLIKGEGSERERGGKGVKVKFIHSFSPLYARRGDCLFPCCSLVTSPNS